MFARTSTAVKMMMVLALALFPLGLIAILASVDAARDGRMERARLARSQAASSANIIGGAIGRDIVALRLITDASAAIADVTEPCALFERAQAPASGLLAGRFAFFDRAGVRTCGDPRLTFIPVKPGQPSESINLRDGRSLRLRVSGGSASAVTMIDRSTLQASLNAVARQSELDVWLQQGAMRLLLIDRYERSPMQRTITSRARLGGSDVFVVAAAGATPVSASEVATILLPLAMWLAAAVLGWLIVDRLLLRPIVAIRRAVLAYHPGGPSIVMPRLVTPATEIRDLGEAFVRVTGTIAAYEAELEAGIARQGRLIREVHHRVKNNLQVVASLLNLHARGARSADASNAYATIQRRVDALAVVHRNHFAELEDDRGVALRALLSELTGNLRATAPDDAAGMAIMLDLDTAHVNQDVAVSVAFFVTEVVEHAMLCTPDDPVGVTLRRTTPTMVRLSLSSASLRADANCDNVDVRQFERISTGLSRQLRAVLDRDLANGVFSIDIATLDATTMAI